MSKARVLPKKRTYPVELRTRVLQDVAAGDSQADVARRYELSESLVSTWLAKHRPAPPASPPLLPPAPSETAPAELERLRAELDVARGQVRTLLSERERLRKVVAMLLDT